MKQDPKNLACIRRWIAENRPDLVAQFNSIVERADRKDPTGTALLMMATVGFQAGRLFQRENPEAGEYEYRPGDCTPSQTAISQASSTEFRPPMR